jgi:hypothetical protein
VALQPRIPIWTNSSCFVKQHLPVDNSNVDYCVYFEIGTEFLNIFQTSFVLQMIRILIWVRIFTFAFSIDSNESLYSSLCGKTYSDLVISINVRTVLYGARSRD